MKKMMKDCGPNSDRAVLVDTINTKPMPIMKKPMRGTPDKKYPKEYA